MECWDRINQTRDVFDRINDMFEWLPLAAVIEKRIICLHGGIGSVVKCIAQIGALKRPIKVQVDTNEHYLPTEAQDALEMRAIIEVLWSDPCQDDSFNGTQLNPDRDPTNSGKMMKFGKDLVD